MAAGAPLSCARRPRFRIWPRRVRRAGLAFALAALQAFAAPVSAQVYEAQYLEPTARYPHGVLGDQIEYGALRLRDAAQGDLLFRLPQTLVFEDIAPRVVDVTGDSTPEVIVVESHQRKGARLAIYDSTGRIAATPFIGTRFRWLAPIAAADLNGDGRVEIAYIDRPHLAKTLRIWQFRRGALHPVASHEGLTNHRIGEDFITSGLRTCEGKPELIVVDASWSRMIAVAYHGRALHGGVSHGRALHGSQLKLRDIGAFDKSLGLTAALACREDL